MARPAAHGVVFRDKAGGAHRAYLSRGPKNEILLSAGATGSPQLLMLSGVGPAAHLRSLGIRVVSDHPMVGRGMADNPMNGVVVPSPKPVELSLVQVVGITPSGNNYIEGGSGINFLSLVTGSAPAMLERETEPNKGEAPKGAFRGGVIIEKVAGPLSTGHLELRSADPGDTPRVTFNYFREAEDLRRCVEGMRAVERVIESGAFAGFRYANVSVAELLNATAGNAVNLLPRHGNYDSTSLEQYCRDTVVSIYHYHGGCRVGRVVDRDYRVVGLDSLRVVDASTFHYNPGTNPQATVMMLGRYMGMKIQEERLGKIVE